MENEILEADDPTSLMPHELENRNRQHQIFSYLAKIIRIYMTNYLKGFFEYYSCQSVIRETIWTTRFKNVADAFHHFNFASKKRKENLRRALHVSLLYSSILYAAYSTLGFTILSNRNLFKHLKK